ncbi:MAG: hypothetical protein LBQ31_10405 [Bacteroidales bacterium]|jgi:hypothetical protein|nr:hypothetical protein [Bacteroidales bacterium]
MKKLFLLLLCVCSAYYLFAMDWNKTTKADPCGEQTVSSVSLYGFQMMGAEPLGFSFMYSTVIARDEIQTN